MSNAGKHLIAVIFFQWIGLLACQDKSDPISHPNVLFISIDDLNDWNELLQGHEQVQTPHLKSFGRQAVTFLKNYCTSPGCNPSRATLMTGLHTYTSGMYSNYQDWRKVPQLADAITLGEYFRNQGYYSAGAGKIFHYDQVAPDCWDDYFPSQVKNMPADYLPANRPLNMPPFKYMYSMFDWGPLDVSEDSLGDVQSVNYISDQLEKEHDRPFFLACGIYRPHLPWYVPKEYFDLFPLDSIQLPKYLDSDTADLGARAQEMITRGGNYHKHVIEADQWKKAVQGYLASIAFADEMVGRLLQKLASSPYKDNTIVVIWSDHGWQLGEKMHWRKFALWENVIRTLLMIRVPEGVEALPTGSPAGRQVKSLTSLIDLYPTLLHLCGLPPQPNLDGSDLTPLLSNPDTLTDRSVITTYDFGDFSLRKGPWHYIRYIDGSEELYHLDTDPEEWTNLAHRPAHQSIMANLRQGLPKEQTPLASSSLLPLMEHHVPPITSKAYYFSEQRKDWLKRFQQQ